MKNLKSKILSEITIGSWITLSDPAVSEILIRAGFDWLAIDMEHSSLSFEQAQQHIRVIDLMGKASFVRVMENNPELIKRFMDAGAYGVIVPLVNCKEDAKNAVDAVKYPPIGKRGVGLSRAQKYSLDLKSYARWNKEQSIVIVQIEHIKAVENLSEILSVEGVDGLMIGLYDLSGSLGIPGDFDNYELIEAYNEIIKKASQLKKLIGQHVVSIEYSEVTKKLKNGIKFIGFGVDFLFLSEFTKNCLKNIKQK